MQDRGDAVRHLELSKHGRRRDGIGRRHDRAKGNSRSDRQACHCPSDERDGSSGENDGAKRQQDERQPIAIEVAQRGVVSRVEKHGRDEQGERQFGIDLDGRRKRQEGDACAGQRQQGGIRNLETPRQRRQRDSNQQENKGQLEKRHASS